LGSTMISCTASDASARTSQCSFTVTLTSVLVLRVTKFLALGYSLLWVKMDGPPYSGEDSSTRQAHTRFCCSRC
jgi:hypothetical protein